jgi:hypothetical protein
MPLSSLQHAMLPAAPWHPGVLAADKILAKSVWRLLSELDYSFLPKWEQYLEVSEIIFFGEENDL